MNMNSAMDKLADIAEQNKHVNEGDYIGSDGLLYCGKCHTPNNADSSGLMAQRKR